MTTTQELIAFRARLVSEIAAALGAEVTENISADSSWYASLREPSMKIWLGFGRDGRLEFEPQAPDYTDDEGRKQRLSIRDAQPYSERATVQCSFTVATSRGAAAIAKDIQRRLLVGCRVPYERALQAAAERTAYYAQKKATAARFARELGAEERRGSFYLDGVTMRVDSDTSVRFEHFCVNPETALAIAKLIVAGKAAKESR